MDENAVSTLMLKSWLITLITSVRGVCDNAIQNPGVPTNIGDCNTPCTGNSRESCGASNRLNVFSDGSAGPSNPPILGYSYLGCFTYAPLSTKEPWLTEYIAAITRPRVHSLNASKSPAVSPPKNAQQPARRWHSLTQEQNLPLSVVSNIAPAVTRIPRSCGHAYTFFS